MLIELNARVSLPFDALCGAVVRPIPFVVFSNALRARGLRIMDEALVNAARLMFDAAMGIGFGMFPGIRTAER